MGKESFPDIVNQLTIEHAPELAYQEFESGQYIANYLETLDGLEVIYPFAKTGVKAVLKGENSENAVAIRADFDALPVKEDTGLSYASRSKGIYNEQETYVWDNTIQ